MSKSEMPEKRKKNTDDARLPAKGLYKFAMGCLNPAAKLLCNVKIHKTDMDKVKPPYIVLANHCSRLDWIYVAMAVRPTQLNAVITRYFYSNPKLKVLLDKVGAIGKDQFTPDVPAVKKIMKTVRMGGSIMLFPEGRTSTSGRSETFERSTIKLLRHLKVPAVAVRMEGSFLTMPKWNASIRRGRVDLNVSPLFLPEDYDKYDDDELFTMLCSKLASDEASWQKRERVKYKGKHFAQGLDGVLHMCPRCGEELVMESDDTSIKCRKCGNGAVLNHYYEFEPFDDDCVIPDSMADWYDLQVAKAREEILANSDFELRSRMTLHQNNGGKWLQNVGEGEGVINSSGFTFTGEKLGEPFELFVPISAIPAFPYDPNLSFDIYYDGEAYNFRPEEGQASQLWSIYGEQIHNIFFAEPRGTKPRDLVC